MSGDKDDIEEMQKARGEDTKEQESDKHEQQTSVLAGNIRRLRKASGMSQRDIADSLGVSISAVSGWERGVEPSLSRAIELARLFDTSVDNLLFHGRTLKIGSVISVPGDARFHPISFPRGYFQVLIYPLVFNRLFLFDIYEKRFVPELIDSYRVDVEKPGYTFYIIKDIRFHDGEPLELEDVKYSFDRYIRERRFFKKYIDKVEIDEEEYSVTLRFHKGRSLELSQLPDPFVIRRAYDGEEHCFVGTGAFKLTQEHKNRLKNGLSEPVTLISNSDYHSRLPHIQNIEFHRFDKHSKLRDALTRGMVNFVVELALDDPDRFRVEYGFGDIPYFLVIKQNTEIGQDKNFRRAVDHALDRESIIDEMRSLVGDAKFLPNNHLYNLIGAPQDNENHYDLDKARGFLEEFRESRTEAGEEPGTPFRIAPMHKGDEVESKLIEEIISQLQKLGIDAEKQRGENIDRADAIVDVVRFDTPLLVYANLHSIQSKTGEVPWQYNNPYIDQLLDEAEGMDAYRKIQEVLSAECVFIPLFRRGRVVTHVIELDTDHRLRVTSLLYGPDVVRWRFR